MTAATFATTADQRVREIRRSHIGIAIEFLKADYPAGCIATMTDCLHAQARVSGIPREEMTP